MSTTFIDHACFCRAAAMRVSLVLITSESKCAKLSHTFDSLFSLIVPDKQAEKFQKNKCFPWNWFQWWQVSAWVIFVVANEWGSLVRSWELNSTKICLCPKSCRRAFSEQSWFVCKSTKRKHSKSAFYQKGDDAVCVEETGMSTADVGTRQGDKTNA